MVCVVAAAIVGDQVRYLFGRKVGPALFTRPDSRLFKQQNVMKAQAFIDKYGTKTIVLARFVPIVRTFVPFVAGAGQMPSHRFALYNAVGAAAWVGFCLGAGLLFGNVPIVKQNFSLVTIGIVIVSLLPVAVEYFRSRGRSSIER